MRTLPAWTLPGWTLPACPHHPELHHAKCTFWYGGPLSNTFRDADGNGYILHWGNRDAVSDAYVLLPVAEEVIVKFEGGNIDDWRDLFLTASHAFLVTVSGNQTLTSEKKTLQEVEEYFPGG